MRHLEPKYIQIDYYLILKHTQMSQESQLTAAFAMLSEKVRRIKTLNFRWILFAYKFILKHFPVFKSQIETKKYNTNCSDRALLANEFK